MKKFITVAIMTILVLGLSACNSANSMLQAATGATIKQSKSIERILADSNIVCQAIGASNSPFIEDMDTDWKAYDLVGEDGNTYLLLLRKADNDFTAVLDSNGELLAGLIDNIILPALFSERSHDNKELLVVEQFENKALLAAKVNILNSFDVGAEIRCDGEQIIAEMNCYVYSVFIPMTQNDGQQDHTESRFVGIWGIEKETGATFISVDGEEWKLWETA